MNNAMEKPRTSWMRKIGWAGFFFFLIKGLIWLGIFLGLGKAINI